MKKIITLGIAVIALISTLWFSAESATAAGTITYMGARFIWGKGVVFVFDASDYKNSDVKDATLTIGSSSFDVHCTANKERGKVICVAGSGLTQYAGQTGILYLAGHAFYVEIPDRSLPPSGNASLSCPPGLVPGAFVTFHTGGGDISPPQFVTGATLAEVGSNAAAMIDGFDWVGIASIGSLQCGQ